MKQSVKLVIQNFFKVQLKIILPVFTLGLFFTLQSTQVAFAGSAVLGWNAPLTNTDGSNLTDLAGYNVYYGTSSGNYTTVINAGYIASSTPTYTVNNLGTGSYYIAVTAYDSSGMESIYSNEIVATFTAPSGPSISGIATSNITTNSATFSWTTDTDSSSQVEYGLTTSYGSLSALDSSLVTSHSETVTGFQAATLYHFRVRSADASNNLTISGDNTFTTSAPVTTGPNISSVSSGNVSATSAVITWTTNTPANSQVQYGISASYGSTTALDSSLVTSHNEQIVGLQASTVYHFRVVSTDGNGNTSVSGDYIFTTSASPVSAPVPVTNPPSGNPSSNNNATSQGSASSAGCGMIVPKNGESSKPGQAADMISIVALLFFGLIRKLIQRIKWSFNPFNDRIIRL